MPFSKASLLHPRARKAHGAFHGHSSSSVADESEQTTRKPHDTSGVSSSDSVSSQRYLRGWLKAFPKNNAIKDSFHTNMLKYLCVINHSVFVGEKEDSQNRSDVAIFGVPLRQSVRYAVVIGLSNGIHESYIYGYLPIIAAKCAFYIKEKGLWIMFINLADSLS